MAGGKELNLSAIERVLQPAIEGFGYQLIFSELGRTGSRPVLRLFIDKPGGITISDCERVSKEVEPILDAEDFFPEKYHLEVSSPGLDRPLRVTDFAKYIGRKAHVELKVPRDGRRKATGVIEKVEEEALTLLLEKQQRFVLQLQEVKKANLIWEEPPKA